MVVEEVPTPTPGPGEALVKIAATGVCHTDLHVIKGEVAFPAPGVLGHEISGHVEALGEDVAGFSVGDRVVGAFIMPCGTCRQCEAGRDDMCEPFFSQNRLRGNLFDGTSRLTRADGSRLSMYSMAGLAEYAVVPLTALTPLPDELPLEESAVLGCAAFTAYGALVRAGGDLTGRSVAVVAVGGVGSSIIQFARHLGADPIIAVDVDDAKLEAARGLGATATVNSTTTDAREAVLVATDGAGRAGGLAAARGRATGLCRDRRWWRHRCGPDHRHGAPRPDDHRVVRCPHSPGPARGGAPGRRGCLRRAPCGHQTVQPRRGAAGL